MDSEKTIKKPLKKNQITQRIEESNLILINVSKTNYWNFDQIICKDQPDEKGFQQIQQEKSYFSLLNALLEYQIGNSYFFSQIKRQENIILENLKINQYFLEKYVATGGEGILFEGFRFSNNQRGETYIFKIYFDLDEKEFDEEIKIMKRFERNINTIQLIDYIIINDSLLITVLEKCQYSLRDELNKIQNNEILFTRQKLFQMIFDLLDGLIQFRIYNILHLDIKPQNILVSQQGHYVYTDFGVSEVYLKNQKIKNKGYTEKYASLEQKKNLPNINFKSDVYQLGVTFQQIIEIYQQTDNFENQFIQDIEKIIKNNMIQKCQDNREECLQLHDQFMKLFMNNIDMDVIQQYQNKINQIIQLIPYDQNKDIPYYSKLKLYYQILKLKFKIITICYQKQIQFQFPFNDKDIGQNFNLFNDSQHPILEFKEIKKYLLQNNFIEIIESLNDIGTSYKSLGDFQNALQYFQNSLEIKKQFINGNHPYIASSLNNVGVCFTLVGDFYQAIKYLLKSLEMTKQIFNENHVDVASSLNNVGQCYKQIGNSENALKYSLESLKMRKQLFKQNHADIALSLNNIGTYNKLLGHSKSALKYFMQSLIIRKKILNGYHPIISSSMNNIGTCYQQLGRFQRALQYFLSSLEMREKLFHENHPDIATSLNNIGICYKSLGDSQNALKYLLSSLKIRKQLFDKNHPNIATSLNNIGKYYSSLGDFYNAQKFLLSSLEMRKLKFNGNHHIIASSLNSVGIGYMDLGDFQIALQYSSESLEMSKQLFKENHPIIASSLNNIGQCYLGLNLPQKALTHLLQSYQMNQQLKKVNQSDVSTILKNIGECYQLIGDTEIAQQYFIQSNEIKQLFNNK